MLLSSVHFYIFKDSVHVRKRSVEIIIQGRIDFTCLQTLSILNAIKIIVSKVRDFSVMRKQRRKTNYKMIEEMSYMVC